MKEGETQGGAGRPGRPSIGVSAPPPLHAPPNDGPGRCGGRIGREGDEQLIRSGHDLRRKNLPIRIRDSTYDGD